MNKDGMLRSLEIGSRQLGLFGDDDQTSADQERFRNRVAGYCEKHGQVAALDALRDAAITLGFSETWCLQQLFWMVQELEVNFRANGRTIAPAQARKHLAGPEPTALQVALNKPADDAVFRGVKAFVERVCDPRPAGADCDQVEFARRLAEMLRTWRSALESCRRFARRPGFPGENKIQAGIDLIDRLVQKLDARSLIQVFFEKSDDIARLIEDIQTLTAFYPRYADPWQQILDFAKAFKATLADGCQDPSVTTAYEAFMRIVSSDEPYDNLARALKLLDTLKPTHAEKLSSLTEQCRGEALSIMGSLIAEMRSCLRDNAADDDLRNQALRPLRSINDSIQQAGSIQAITRYLQAAQDAFDLSTERIFEQDVP